MPAEPPALAAESVPSTAGSTAQVTGTGPAGPSTSVPSRIRLIREPGSSSAFQAASRVAASVSNSAADGDRVTGATTASRTGSYCLLRCQPTKVCVYSLVDDAVSRTWMATGMIPNARFSTSRPGAMVMLNGADVPTSTARPTFTVPTSIPPGAVVLAAQASTDARETTVVAPRTTRTVGSARRAVRATTEPVTVTVTPGPATGGVMAPRARVDVSVAAAGTTVAAGTGLDAYAAGASGPSTTERRSSARTRPRRGVTRCLPAAPRRPVRYAVRWGR